MALVAEHDGFQSSACPVVLSVPFVWEAVCQAGLSLLIGGCLCEVAVSATPPGPLLGSPAKLIATACFSLLSEMSRKRGLCLSIKSCLQLLPYMFNRSKLQPCQACLLETVVCKVYVWTYYGAPTLPLVQHVVSSAAGHWQQEQQQVVGAGG